jgi:hypothetical protein
MIDTPPFLAALVRFGAANPEKVENPLWLEALRGEWSGWRMRESFPDAPISRERPFWSWERYGRSTTRLPDGRVVHIAGEYEDFYDPDFCIYNDVVVEHSDDRVDFYLYPQEIFPPTDFHSATLMGGWIYLLGSLGYAAARGANVQVMRLATRDFHIERVETTGEAPGWLSRHRAEQLDDARILVLGGQFFSQKASSANRELFELDVTTQRWRRREHGDTSLFAISRDVYEACKSPRFGTANPEKVDNPFWLEMAKRRWLPSRARLHYGDFGPDDPKRPPTREEIDALPTDTIFKRKPIDCPKVWTSVRAEASTIELADGRRIQIGGVVRDFEDGFEEEWSDVWTYADVIVEHAGGEIEILLCPREILPPLWPFCAISRQGCVLIFGDIDRSEGREHSWPVVLRLDVTTFEITVLDEGGAPPRAFFGAECHRVEGDLALFEIGRDTSDQPRRGAVFDMTTLQWRDELRPWDPT